MENVQDGTVYLGLNADFSDEADTAVGWSGHWESSRGSQFETGPDFLDASDAVTWWRERGAKRIYIRLDFSEYLWAGEGIPPDDSSILSVFDPADARGRPDGAARTLDAERRAFAEVQGAERVTAALDEGHRLTRRREALHLSIKDLADRVGQSRQWLLDVESGKSTYDVTFSQWVYLVWATRKGWPDEMRVSETRSVGWVAQRGQLLREAEVVVNKMIGLYD
jgi:DNA-binding XRE family transcriptional regulator